MRRGMICALAGLGLTLGLVGTAPAKPPVSDAVCTGDFGTMIQFKDSPVEAASLAKKNGKLVLVLHVSGHFEDPALT